MGTVALPIASSNAVKADPKKEVISRRRSGDSEDASAGSSTVLPRLRDGISGLFLLSDPADKPCGLVETDLPEDFTLDSAPCPSASPAEPLDLLRGCFLGAMP